MVNQTYSFSKISAYRTCAYQWYHKYIEKTVVFKPTAATQWGTDIHAAAEHYINDAKPLTDRYEVLKPYLDLIDNTEGTKRAEVEYAVTKDLKPCGFWDKSAYLRGKLDVEINQGDRVQILDWKSGKFKNDFNELRCFSVLTFLNNPEVEKTRNVYIWLKKDSKPTIEIIDRSQITALLEPLQETMSLIERDIESGLFRPKPSGLCKSYCDVLECKHNGRA